MNDLRDLYQQVILDHNRSPQNFHAMASPSCSAEGFNPLCGDHITLYLKIENGMIQDVSFQGEGCAISKASASLMTEALKNKTTQEALHLFDNIHQLLTGKSITEEALGKLTVLSGVTAYPMRVKCATLAWHTLKNALTQQHKITSTE